MKLRLCGPVLDPRVILIIEKHLKQTDVIVGNVYTVNDEITFSIASMAYYPIKELIVVRIGSINMKSSRY